MPVLYRLAVDNPAERFPDRAGGFAEIGADIARRLRHHLAARAADHDAGADRHAVVKVDDVGIEQPDTAGLLNLLYHRKDLPVFEDFGTDAC